jgi:hypothetical protein
MPLIITKHAYKRARQRLGLCKKAFKRMVEQKRLSPEIRLVVVDDVVVTVHSVFSNGDREVRHRLSKAKIMEYFKKNNETGDNNNGK